MTSIASRILLRASHSSWLAAQVQRRAFAQRAVRRFMPGESLTDAIDAADRLRTKGLGTLLTQLGENVGTEADARAVAAHYREVLSVISSRDLPAQVSVKPTQLGLDLERELCAELLDGLLENSGGMLWVDMEDSRYTDVTLDLVQRAARKHPKIGVCLQSYLYRTNEDLSALFDTSIAIRLVKGAYNEPAAVAFPRKRDVDENYCALGRRLLERTAAGGPGPVFGTHDSSMLDHLAADAKTTGVAQDGYEVHMLYGIRSAEQVRLAENGVPVRVLISYGDAWFPWYVRRLAERPANVWFVVKSLF